MKAKTISYIKDMLKQNYDIAYADYVNYTKDLRQKYGINFNMHVDEQEKRIWNAAKNKTYECLDLMDDFNNHDWT